MTEAGQRWFEQHMEEFVKPHMGLIPNIDHNDAWIKTFTPQAIRALRGVWHESKRRAKGRTILLPGRDVFLLEILARLDDYPTVFRPDISSAVAYVLSDEDKAAFKSMLCIDTGYRGSVPKALNMGHWCLLRFTPPVNVNERYQSPEYFARVKPLVAERQLFPLMRDGSKLHHLTVDMEGCPKYWHRAEYNGVPPHHTVCQNWSSPEMFKQAAMLTQHIVGKQYNPTVMIATRYMDWLPHGYKYAMIKDSHANLRVGRRDTPAPATSNLGGTLSTSADTSYISYRGFGTVSPPV